MDAVLYYVVSLEETCDTHSLSNYVKEFAIVQWE
jgi:hypothetical protein